MKTKIQFEEEDFNACGQIIVRDSFKRGSKKYSHAVTVAYKVGYVAGTKRNTLALTSLADGMVITFDGMKELVNHLNEDEIGFRPLEMNELIEVIKEAGNRFTN